MYRKKSIILTATALHCSMSSSGSRSHFSERQSHTPAECWLDLANSFIHIKTKFYFKLLTLLFWYLLLIPQGASDEKFYNMEYYISNINYVHILYVLYMYKCIKCIKSIIYVLLFCEAALSCCPCLSAPPYALSLFMHSLHIQILIWHFCPIYFHLFAHDFFGNLFQPFCTQRHILLSHHYTARSPIEEHTCHVMLRKYSKRPKRSTLVRSTG